MLLQKEKLQHLNSIAHEGKVVVIATDAEGQIHYTIKQDGFEDSYLNTPADQRTGWEEWKKLEFPNEAEDDASVVEKETEEFTRQDNSEFLIRSRYRTQHESAVAPVQLISGLGHIYVFRQSKENTLFVDRFVLDGMTNELTRKLEVRFKRSRQKYKPTEDMKMGAGGLQNVDSLDYRDTNNDFFYEPTTELKLVNNLHNGWFSVVQVPTNEHDKYRWHIFAYNSQTQKVQLTTIRASEEGLFDIKDYLVLEPKSETDVTLVPRSIAGIIQRTLDIQGVTVTNGLAATKYDIQQEKETKAGPQLMRTSSKVMLAIPTDQGTAALSFAIAGDGTLSQIDETPQNQVLRSTERDVLLPLNTLEDIKTLGDTTPPPQGTITGFSVGTEADNAEDLVKITSPETVNLVSGDLVEIQNTTDYDGLYQATKIDEDTFTIELPSNEEMGSWETVEEEGGLIFDGMVTAYERTADGKLKVTASNHGLDNGDEVLLIGTQDYDNTYQIQKIDDANFVIQRQWRQSEAVNVKLESRKRRGIVLDGEGDYLSVPDNPALHIASYTVEMWIKPNGVPNERWKGIIGKPGKPETQYSRHFNIWLNRKGYINHRFDTSEQTNAGAPHTPNGSIQWNQWNHIAITNDGTTAKTYINGELKAEGLVEGSLLVYKTPLYIGRNLDGNEGRYFNGQIADVRIWQKARSEKEIKDSMYLQLTGREVDLVGYWRLGGISEGKERQVVDFSVNGNHGIVHGDPYVGGVTLSRTLRDGMPAVKYSNGDLVAVSQRATYIEEFEFKITGGTSTTQTSSQPPVKDGLQVYLSGESLTGDRWDDLSGQQNHATQAPDCDIALSHLVTDYNGKQFTVARFTPTGGMILPDSFSLDKPFTAIIIDRYYGNTHKGRTLQSREINWLLGKHKGRNACYMKKWMLERYPATVGEFTLSTVTLEGDEPRWYTDGKLRSSRRGKMAPGRLGFCKGGKFSREVSEADIACALIYDRVLSEEERQQVERWLGDRYGITVPHPTPAPSASLTPVSTINDLFDFSYWGKTSRSADEKIAISAQQDDFEDLGNEWYKASCRFTIPDGVALLRTFEINDVRGDWDTLEIRKHHMRMVSDAITEAKYGDSVSLTTLVDNSSELEDELKILEVKEREESTLLQEKSYLEELLALLKDLSKLDAAIQIKQGEVDQKQNRINELDGANGEVKQAEEKYYLEKDNPLNYWCNLYCRYYSDKIAYQIPYQFPYLLIQLINTSPKTIPIPFKFEKIDGEYYHITAYPKLPLHKGFYSSTGEIDKKAVTLGRNNAGTDHKTHWSVKKQWHGYYYIKNRSTKSVFDVATDTGLVINWRDESSNPRKHNQHWTIEKTDEKSNTREEDAKQEWNDKQEELRQTNTDLKRLELELEELQKLKDSIGKNDGSEADLTKRLQKIIGQLSTVQQELNLANTNFLDGVKQTQQTAYNYSDSNSQGTLLGFVNPACRLNAIETCEGNVQLSYFDNQGRMRRTLYDATSDSLNTTFEQWIPDSLRTCLNFNKPNSIVQLNPTLSLGGSSTVEAWFAYPFTQKLEWQILASSEDNKQQIVVYLGKYLGLRIDGIFFECGYDLDKLSRGWHHLALATKQQQDNTTFYLDGEKVGETQGKSVIQFDGKEDFIELSAIEGYYTLGLTIEAWVYYHNFNFWSRILDFAVADDNEKILVNDIVLGNEGKDDNTLFFCVNNQYIRVPNALELDQWMHLAVTVDSLGNVTIYKNGAIIKTDKASIPTNIKRNHNYIGKSQYNDDGTFDGEIAEVRLWNLARTQTQIRANLGKTLAGTESGLIGYWNFAGGEAKDSSSNKYDGTIVGNPGSYHKLAKFTRNIATIGNIAGEKSKQTQSVSTVTANTALSFNGIDDYIKIRINEPEQEVTHELWFKTSTPNCGIFSVIFGDFGQGDDRHLYLSNGNIKARIYSNQIIESKNLNLADNNWHHLAHVFGSSIGGQKIYVDGQLVASGNKGISDFDRQDGIVIGYSWDAQPKYFKGQIAEVRVWKKARTQTQIQAEMNKTLTGNEPDLLAYWPLRDASAQDYTANGNNGNIIGSPQTVPFDKVQVLTASNVGESVPNHHHFGKLAEVRIWDIGLSDEEIAVNSKTLLSGNEPGLLAYYPMNEATGPEVRDHSGNNRHATMVGASWWGCTAPIGNLGHTVMQFDGENDSIDCGNEINLANSSFTIDFWAKRSALGKWNIIIGQGQPQANKGLHIGFQPDNKFTFAFYGNDLDAPPRITDFQWHHWACTYDATNKKRMIYLDGNQIAEQTASAHYQGTGNLLLAKFMPDGEKTNPFSGQLAEVRIWNKARTPEEIRATMHQRLSGKENHLVGYWVLNTITAIAQDIVETPDLTGNHSGKVHEAITTQDNTLPIGGDAVVSSEYSTITVDPVTQRKSAIMRRFFASPVVNGVQLLPEKRIEQLQLQWIGNAQFAPTLLGYIEGAPPIPSENLTESEDYNGATSVELAMSEDVDFSWSRAQDSGLGASIELFAGAAAEAAGGLGVSFKTMESRVGFKGALDFSYQFINESNITSSSSTSMTNSLELRGSPEQTPKFPHLGTRFIPKNVGYALVISSLADVFITKLIRSGKMVGYEVRPVEGIPPDVNTITFLMNPAYTMNGSLDGMTGSSATSDRFFRHVPEMRSQYGSLYPASYYRLKEAYDLKQAIEREDKRRESYFQQFNARLLDETSLSREIENKDYDVENITVQREEDKPNENLTEEEKQAQQDARIQKLEEQAETNIDQQKAAVEKKREEIDAKIQDQEKRAHATDSFAGWQKKMENILIRAGKRNIVNTYVWDADGGLRAEAQSFATTAEHTIGGSFSLGAGLGMDTMFMLGAQIELTALATVNLTQTMTKTEARSKGFELNVDLSGIESIGITDYNDYPIMPGKKVDRYRFMSFYLENSTNNFHDFFNYVVDPEWLRSNDEEARALRQAMGKANKTWRVLHRVTYVERPALMGFGRDVRKLSVEDRATQEILNYFDKLDAQHQELKAMLVQLLNNQQKK